MRYLHTLCTTPRGSCVGANHWGVFTTLCGCVARGDDAQLQLAPQYRPLHGDVPQGRGVHDRCVKSISPLCASHPTSGNSTLIVMMLMTLACLVAVVMELLHSDLHRLLHHSSVELSFYTRMKMCKDIALGSTFSSSPAASTLAFRPLQAPPKLTPISSSSSSSSSVHSELAAQNRARCSAQGTQLHLHVNRQRLEW
jgi:hypothetical protein